MKIVQIADIHVQEGKITEHVALLKQLADSIKVQKPDLIVVAGDLFIHRDHLTPNQVALLRDFFLNQLGKFTKIIITGNHDISLSASKVDSISAVFSHQHDDSNLTIFNRPGDYYEVQMQEATYRFHCLPYPTKKVMKDMGMKTLEDVLPNCEFDLSADRVDILVFHGTLGGFAYDSGIIASEADISVGLEFILPKEFYSKFDAVMCGHLHKTQMKGKAVYCGCPWPMTFADDHPCGFVVWEDMHPTFVEVPALYPYKTIDLGEIKLKTGQTDEAVRRLEKYSDKCLGAYVRVRYSISQDHSGTVEHGHLGRILKGAKSVKVVPKYLENTKESEEVVTIDDFKDGNIRNLIDTYIEKREYPDIVTEIADKIESDLALEQDEDYGIHFKPHRLTLSNFKAFGKDAVDLDLDALGNVVGVFGKNMQGKSSLVEGLLWALFGKTPRNKTVTTVIRNGEEEVKVSLTFSSRGSTYKVTRVKRYSGSGSLVLHKKIDNEFVDIQEGASATQQKIASLVGTYDMLVSTIYAPQNELDNLLKQKPAKRKELIMACLQVSVLDKRTTAVAELRKNRNEERNIVVGQLSGYSSDHDSLLLNNPVEGKIQFEALLMTEKENNRSKREEVVQLRHKLHEFEQQRAKYKSQETDLKQLRADLNLMHTKVMQKKQQKENLLALLEDSSAVDAGILRIEEAEEKIKEYNDEQARNTQRKLDKDRLSKQQASICKTRKSQRRDIERGIESLRTQLGGKKELDCTRPDCPINDNIAKARKRLNNDIVELEGRLLISTQEEKDECQPLFSQMNLLIAEVDNSFYDDTIKMQYMTALRTEEKAKWREIKSRLQSGQSILEQIDELIVTHEQQLVDMKARRTLLEAEVDSLASALSALAETKTKASNTEQEVRESERRIENHSAQVARCESMVQQIANLEARMKELQRDKEGHDEFLLGCSKYSDIIGRNGIMYQLVSHALPRLESFTQNILADVTDGALSISIDPDKELKKGGKLNEMVIWLIDSKGKRDVSEASGAELVLVSLALRAAMADLLSYRTGRTVELFIIDEGMGALDDDLKILIKKMFTSLGKMFNKVLLITHVSEIKDVVDSTIEVFTVDNASTIRIIGE